MKHSIEPELSCGSFFVVTEGKANVQGLIAFLKGIISHPLWKPGMSLLVDHRRLSLKDFSRAETETVVDYFVRIGDKLGSGKCALVMNRDVDFGIARSGELLASQRTDVDIRVFRSLEEAEDWLAEGSLILSREAL